MVSISGGLSPSGQWSSRAISSIKGAIPVNSRTPHISQIALSVALNSLVTGSVLGGSLDKSPNLSVGGFGWESYSWPTQSIFMLICIQHRTFYLFAIPVSRKTRSLPLLHSSTEPRIISLQYRNGFDRNPLSHNQISDSVI
jgi:hypothetical protein